MATHTENKTRKLSIFQLLVGSFALTYYFLLGLLVALALFFNRFLIDTGYYDNGLEVIQSNSLVLVLALVMLIVAGAVAGLILFLFKKSSGLFLFVISALLLMIIQAIFSGFEGWQKFAVEFILILLLLIAPSKKIKSNEIARESKD